MELVVHVSVFTMHAGTTSALTGVFSNDGQCDFGILKARRGCLWGYDMGSAKGPKPCFWLSKRSQNGSKLRARSVPAAKWLQGGSGGPPGPQNVKKTQKTVLRPVLGPQRDLKTRCALRGLLASNQLHIASKREPKWFQNGVQKGPMENMGNCAPV